MKDENTNLAVSSVHQALNRAISSERERVALVNANFKINPVHKELTEGICLKNGTTISSFLRECCTVLLIDYLGPKEAARLGIEIV